MEPLLARVLAGPRPAPAEKRRGLACDFILWMSARWQEWRRANGKTSSEQLWPSDHAAFARELAERYPST